MIYTLLEEGDAFLKKSVGDFSFVDAPINPVELADDLIETMRAHNAFGLAANQVGLPYRVFVLEALPGSEKPIVCFNPEIIQTSDVEIKEDEGCLSFPGLVLNVKRPILVVVSYQDQHGEKIQTQFNNMHARGYLHETDHLNGITFDTKVSKLGLERGLKSRKKNK